jgi:hypothetical protein
MMRRFFIFIPFCIFLFSCATLGNNKINKENKTDKIEYRINNKIVPEDSFKDLLNFLIQLPHTWFCAETAKGGITGYDAEDRLGVIFEYRAVSEPGNNKCSLTEKKLLRNSHSRLDRIKILRLAIKNITGKKSGLLYI